MTRFRAAGNRSTRALKVPNFRDYFIGQTLSTVGTGMQMLAQTWLVLDLTGSAAKLGLTITLQTLPLLLLGPWGGAIADRVDNRKVIVVVSTSSSLLAGALGVLVATHHVTMAWIWIFAVLLGIIQAFERPAGQALLYELVGPADLPSAVGLNGTLNATTRLLGPAVAGLVIATLGMAACFFANAISFAAVIVAVTRIRRETMFPRRAAHGQVRIRDGMTYAWHTPVIRRGLVAMTIAGTFAYNFQQLVPTMVRFEFHSGPGALGLVQGISGVGGVLGGLAVASLVMPTNRTVGIAAVIFSVLLAGAALSPTIILFGLIFLPAGVASAVYTASTQALLQRGASAEHQGRVMALFSMAWIGTTPIGATIQGFVIDRWSARVGLMVGAAAALVAGGYLLSRRAVAPAAAAKTPSIALRPTSEGAS